MSDKTEPDADTRSTENSSRPLNAKSIRRRIDKINASGSEGPVKGKTRKLAKLSEQILTQIAEGQIRNPVAAARAYIEGTTSAPTAPTNG